MKAVMMREPGGPEVLQVVEMEPPRITAPQQMLVKLAAAGVNPVDTKIRARGPMLPGTLTAVLGCDGAGTVVATGAAVTRFQPGDRVWFCYGGLGGPVGTYAESIVIDERAAQPVPPGMELIHAAAAPLVLITAWEALHDRARLRPEQTVLIHGGAGGVGHVAIQLARAAGARVATTVGHPDKAEFVRALGAEYVIDYRRENFVEAIARWTGGRGVDVALDTVGGATLNQTVAALAIYGDLVTLLQPGADFDLTEARVRNLRLSLVLMLTPQLRYLPHELARQGDILRRCGELIAEGRLRIEVSATFPLAQAAVAHHRLAAGEVRGKLALTIP